MSIFAKRLQELRLESGLSCNALSKKIGVQDTTIGKWEKGARVPNIDYLVTLAKFFNVTADYLVGMKDE